MNLFISIVYTNPAQLYNRLKYLVKRKVASTFTSKFRRRLNRKSNYSFKINVNFRPDSFSSKHTSINKKNDSYELTFLNESRIFKLPFNWHAAELNKGTRLWKLNLHYMEYLSELSDIDFQLIINDWIDANPPYNKDYALDNWNSYALSIRAVVWMQQFILRKKRLPSDFKIKLLNSLNKQLHFLYYNPETDIGGNHIIKNIKALLWAGKFFISDNSKKWQIKGEKLLSKQLDIQILEDGTHYELSPSYHIQVFIDLLECYNFVNNPLLKKRLFEKLSKMAQVISDLSMSDGFIAQFSDGSYSMAARPVECLKAWSTISGEKVLQNQVVSLPDGGYYGYHDKILDLIIDCGRLGADSLPAHGHGDIFSFELCLNKSRVIIDPGVFEYNAGEKRNYSRATKAHNTVTIDDKDQGEFYSSFRLGRRAKVFVNKFIENAEGIELSATHTGYTRLKNKPLHQRTFRLTGLNFYVEDIILRGAAQSVKTRLLINPKCSVIPNKNEIRIYNNNTLLLLLQTNFNISVIDAVWFPEFGVEIPCKQIVIDYGLAPCKGEFMINIVSDDFYQHAKIKSYESTLI